MTCIVGGIVRIIGVIQARTGSTRLPGKVMYPLAGEPVLRHLIRRTRASDRIERVVVATSESRADDVLATVARRVGASVFRGSEVNVLGRIADAVEETNAEAAVRIGGDNPLVHPDQLDVLTTKIAREYDYASCKIKHTFPIGLNPDAFTMEAIRLMANRAETDHHREHVAKCFQQHLDALEWANVLAEEVFEEAFIESVPDFPQLRLTLDESKDYRLLSRVYEKVEYDGILPTRDAITYIVENDLRDINSGVDQDVF